MVPAFSEFAADTNSALARYDPDDPDAFIEHVRPALDFAVSSKLYISALNELLKSISSKDKVANISTTNGSFIFFSANSHSNWSFIFHNKPLRFLYLSPLTVVQSHICGSALQVNKYRCNSLDSLDVFDSNVQLEGISSSRASIGEIHSRKARTEILDWHTVVSESGPGVTIRVNSVIPASFEWYFDRTTMRPKGMIPINVIDSNITTLLCLLSVAGDQDSIDCIEPLLTSPAHYVRWAAAQTIASINAEQGLDVIGRLADDPHKEVRSAARTHLAQFVEAGVA